MRNPVQLIAPIWLIAFWLLAGGQARAAKVEILNVASEVTQDFFQDYNTAFSKYWKDKTGQTAVINQSTGDSHQQSQSIVNSVDADIVALDQPSDIDALNSNGRFLDANWSARLPNRSVPFSTTIVFLVRKGNPKDIRNWSDLVRTNVSIVTTNPKASSEGRYSYLAAWGYALKKSAGDENAARRFITRLFANVPILEAGGSDAEAAFALWGKGDVLLTFESAAALVQKRLPRQQFEVVLPSVSIVTENAVAWLDHDVERHRNEAAARAYLDYLYSDEGQELAAQHFFRPGNETILARYSTRYKPLELLTVREIAGSWQKAQRTHFVDGGVFDQIHKANRFTGGSKTPN
jgi:sulfate/thiosulfate transport system substrate-binding protein